MTATVVAVTALRTFYGQAATVTITDHPGEWADACRIHAADTRNGSM